MQQMMQTLTSVSRTFYGIAMLAFGLLHIVYGDFVTRVVPWWPAAIPGRSIWAYLAGVLLIAAGTAVLINRSTALVATGLAVGLGLSFLLLGVPLAASDALFGGGWTVAGKALAFCGGALLIARASGSPSLDARVMRLARLGPWFLVAFLVLCGIQHFLYGPFVVSLFPPWIPWPLFWTYFAAVALIAGGVGLIVPLTARLAGLLTGLMIFSWVFLIHIPLALRRPTSNEITAVFEALAMSAIAWLAATTATKA